MQRHSLLTTATAIIVIAILFISGSDVTVRAHGGGTPRLIGAPAGPYLVYVWTQPEPLRAGEVHLTIGLTNNDDAATGGPEATADGDIVALTAPVTDATVTVQMVPPDEVTAPIEKQATPGGLGAVYYETDASLLTAGPWQFIISVDGNAGAGTAEFSEDLLAARTVNVPMFVGGGVLFVVLIGLVGLWNRRK